MSGKVLRESFRGLRVKYWAANILDDGKLATFVVSPMIVACALLVIVPASCAVQGSEDIYDCLSRPIRRALRSGHPLSANHRRSTDILHWELGPWIRRSAAPLKHIS